MSRVDAAERKLVERLRRIEALHAGAKTRGERTAAGAARERILERLRSVRATDPPREYKFTMADEWSRRVLVALLRRYGIQPYRYKRQRHTTVMARVPARFVDETLWPEFKELSSVLREYLDDVTQRVIAEAIHGDSSDAGVVVEPPLLE